MLFAHHKKSPLSDTEILSPLGYIATYWRNGNWQKKKKNYRPVQDNPFSYRNTLVL